MTGQVFLISRDDEKRVLFYNFNVPPYLQGEDSLMNEEMPTAQPRSRPLYATMLALFAVGALWSVKLVLDIPDASGFNKVLAAAFWLLAGVFLARRALQLACPRWVPVETSARVKLMEAAGAAVMGVCIGSLILGDLDGPNASGDFVEVVIGICWVGLSFWIARARLQLAREQRFLEQYPTDPGAAG